jgi:hydroxysqualene synthase
MGDYLKKKMNGRNDNPSPDHDMTLPEMKTLNLKKTTRRMENFPVASRLVAPEFRPAMIAFYNVARGGDDIADDPTRSPSERAVGLDRLEAGLDGHPDGDPRGLRLVRSLQEIGRDAALTEGKNLLAAFRADLRTTRYRTWEDLMEYCGMSAVPVGRFVLELHGENDKAHEPADALCIVLQVLNHLQDLKSDYMNLGRIYLPAEWIEDERDLAGERLTPALRHAVDRALAKTDALLETSADLPNRLQSQRLSAEIGIIISLAQSLQRQLRVHDPIARRVTASRSALLTAAIVGMWRLAVRRRGSRIIRTQGQAA